MTKHDDYITLGQLIDAGTVEITLGFPCGNHNCDGEGIPHIRPFNIQPNGKISLEQIKSIPLDLASGKPTLRQGDIVFNNTNTKELVGKCAVWEGNQEFVFSNHMTRIRLHDKQVNNEYLNFAILHHWITRKSEMLARSHVAQASIIGERFREVLLPWRSKNEQTLIANLLTQTHRAISFQEKQIKNTFELKNTVMLELFTRGLRNEEQSHTEIGLIPKGWRVDRLEHHADIISTRMTYSDLEKANTLSEVDTCLVGGIKVSDMNLEGNETYIFRTNLTKQISRLSVEYRCAPPGTIIFPKRGAAIATNKKRLTKIWTAFDPNIIGLIAHTDLDKEFLFYWFQNFDLKKITESGPTPQLNKKDLEPLLIPIPPSIEEQKEITDVLRIIDRKLDLHRKKQAVLENLFKTLLHTLMTDEVQISSLDLSELENAADIVGAST